MNLTRTAYGTWSGGRFMHFGEMLEEDRYLDCIRLAYESGVRTFVSADVYGQGKADAALAEALAAYPRNSYCLVGTIGHDFYKGSRAGAGGYPRFTDPALRSPAEYRSFLRMACEKSLANCRTDHFDLLLLHNPDELGYTQEDVWKGMAALKEEGMAERLGVAPGPANGFTLDLIHCFENYGDLIDWAMIILNPLEPWPGQCVLPAAAEHGVDILTRVVDYGGFFHGDMNLGHEFKPGDHRAYRPQGWVDRGHERITEMRPVIDAHRLSLLHFASLWNLSQVPVKSVVPTFIQEAGDDARPIEDKIREFGELPETVLNAEEVEAVRAAGDNTGCMALKGASKRHERSERPDEWPMRSELLELARRHGLGAEW
ncbi:MAG: general stress protein [Roseibacillus sp.]|nr:general stress protein [Roseibacillus sp.]